METKDLSKGGLYFVADTKWKVGTPIECVIQLPVQVLGERRVGIQCLGKIVRVVADGGRVGVGATIQSFRYVRLGEGLERAQS